jgi:RNA polymerase sigma-70 factor (ECF subfamily)
MTESALELTRVEGAVVFESLRSELALAVTPAASSLAIALTAPESANVEGSRPRGSRRVGSGRGSQQQTPEATAESDRLRALVELATRGDAEAFGQLYDHYVTGIYRFVYYRVGSVALAEDLTSDTFGRALRSIQSYTWQGKDFGAWLTTIARNLIIDHHKSSRARLEIVTDIVPERPASTAGPEQDVLSSLTNESLMAAVNALPDDQRDCILMRFIQGLSIAETAAGMDKTEGAIKQLQLRAVRNLAKTVERDQ